MASHGAGAEPTGALEPSGPVARVIAELWWVMLALGTVTFLIFAVVLIAGFLRGRPSADDPEHPRGNRMILLGGVALPAVVLTVVLVLTVNTMRAIPNAASSDALQIDVIGHMWWWEIHYPEYGIVTANEVHLPVGRPVEFRLISADVIHSFWLPTLSGKMDLLPEDVNTLVLEADEPGVFRSQCAEFCGLQHARMGIVAVAESEEEFAAWVAEQQEVAPEPTSALTRRGLAVFASAGCASCHTIRGTDASGDVGPDLTHLASRRALAAGTLPNTTENLADWIANPQEIKHGVEMPDVELDPEEMEALVAYLETLE